MKKIYSYFVWGLKISVNAPSLGILLFKTMVKRRFCSNDKSVQICIGTHHKVLTVLFARIFRVFAATTFRTYSLGRGSELDLKKDILIDHHSEFEFSKLQKLICGLHVRRDPRDLLVSAAFYHMKSSEKWLSIVDEKYGNISYQEYTNSLPNMESRLLFELDNSAGKNIRDIVEWKGHMDICELKYEDLVASNGIEVFKSHIQKWPIQSYEKELIVKLFSFFSLSGPGAKMAGKHIRNAKSGQWQVHITKAVDVKFNSLFPKALEKLGYK
jgi:hypothetical protein